MKETTQQNNGKKLAASKQECHKWLHIENDEYIDVLFGVHFANQLDAKPVWLYLIGPPGSGKTVALQSWDGHASVFMLSSLTENTLVSGKVRDNHIEKDPSLLPKLDKKVVVIKDFTLLLKKKYDVIASVFGQLRDIYDGKTQFTFGTGETKEYKVKFGLIAAVTNEIDRHASLLASLGERFLMYRLPKLSDAETEARALRAAESEAASEQEVALQKAAHKVLNIQLCVPKISNELKNELVAAAIFTAVCRTTVYTDRQTRKVDELPNPEIPTRLTKQLVCLAKGIAMARERDLVTASEVQLVKKVALHSVPPLRLKIIKQLKIASSVTALAQRIGLPNTTIERNLEKLQALGVVGKKQGATVNTPNCWGIVQKYQKFVAGLEKDG